MVLVIRGIVSPSSDAAAARKIAASHDFLTFCQSNLSDFIQTKPRNDFERNWLWRK